MAVVNVKINGRDYQIACDDGQEQDLCDLAYDVDERVRALVHSMGRSPGEFMALLLTALTMSDEIIENKKEINGLSREVRKLSTILNEQKDYGDEGRMAEIESAMAVTIDEIAERIEKIADQIEIR